MVALVGETEADTAALLVALKSREEDHVITHQLEAYDDPHGFGVTKAVRALLALDEAQDGDFWKSLIGDLISIGYQMARDNAKFANRVHA